MNILKRVALIVVLLIIIVFTAGTVYVKYYGKALLESALNRSLKRSVELGEASYAFPFGIKARNIRVGQSPAGEKFLEAEDIVAQLSPEALTQKKLIFESVVIVKPAVFFEKKGSGAPQPSERRHGLNVPPPGAVEPHGEEGISPEVPARKNAGPPEIVIRHAVLKGGSLHYINNFGDKDFSFALDNVYVRAGNILFPAKAGRADFNLSARLVKEGNPLSGSMVEGHGWVDPVSRDMDVRVEIVEQDGTVGLTAHAVAGNNDVDVSGEVKFKNMFSGIAAKEGAGSSGVDDLIFGALSTAGVEIGAQYSFKTKMDDFRLEKIAFSGNVVTK